MLTAFSQCQGSNRICGHDFVVDKLDGELIIIMPILLALEGSK